MSGAGRGPRVAVVVPCYNAEPWIEACIASVLGQTLDALELVVVDDGSTDGSLELIREFDDSRLRILEQANSGVSVARNRGAGFATAPLLAFLDADDLFEPVNLERKADVLEGDPAAVLVHSHRIDFEDGGDRAGLGGRLGGRDSSGEVRDGGGDAADTLDDTLVDASACSGDSLEPLLRFEGMVNGPSSAVIRRSAFEAVGGFDPSLSTSADRDLWIRLARRGSFRYIPEPLVRYRRHEEQMHRDVDAMERDLRIIGRKLRADPGIPVRLQREFLRKRARLLAGSFLHDRMRPLRACRWGLEYLVRAAVGP